MPRESHPSRRPPETCPACGADVPRTALACPECGADYETGWNEEDAAYDALDLPDHEFDYDECVRREFGDSAGIGSTGHGKRVAAVVITIVCIGLLLLCIKALLR